MFSKDNVFGIISLNLPRHPASAWPPPPSHGGWPSPTRPSRMKFQPRPRFEAFAAGAFFVHLLVFWEAPGAPWRPLQGPGAPCNGLELRGNPPHAWMKRSNLYRPYFILRLTIYTMMGLAFWVHLIGVCGGL